jgi:two-component system, cell cycle sensor histidine kinase and response regulator CckA
MVVRCMTINDRSGLATVRILLLEHTKSESTSALETLSAAGLNLRADRVRDLRDFKERLASSQKYDLILCDFTLPGRRGADALRWARKSGYQSPFIYFSGDERGTHATNAFRAGATDYVSKNDLARLPFAVERALAGAQLRRDLKFLQMEQEESEKRFHFLFDGNLQPLWILDRKTQSFLAVNEAAINHYGYSREEFLAMTIRDVRPKRSSSSNPKSVSRARPPKKGSGAEVMTHRKKDGSLITVKMASHAVNFRGVDSTLVLTHDITDVLRSEQRLRQSEERFSIAFRSSPMAITISTLADGLYIDANENFLRMLGRSREEVVGHTSFELNVWETPEDRSRILEELRRTGAISAFETRFLSRSRGPRSVQISAERIMLDGVPCVLAITNDVTEAKILEEQLRQSQKMEAVGRLAGGVAHDFNNMLGVIIGYCDLAEGRADWQAVERDVSRIKKAAQRAVTLTSQLLAFSRQQVLRPSVLNLNAVVAELLTMLARIIAANIEVKFEPAWTLGNVKADASQIEQILINLVLNAGDAMPQGGTIIIETGDVEMDEALAPGQPNVRPGRYCVLSVTDTGSGMSSETLSKIFEPFFTTKPAGDGTGLGLSMVYGAMQQAGGYIGVYSEEGKGTTFRLYFPRVEEEVDSRPAAEPEPFLTKGWETILLVEDEAGLREMTGELLKKEGYTVLEAADGPSAVKLSAEYETPIHVLLTDLVLPGLNGREVANRISKMHPSIKVLYMSGYTGRLVATQGLLDPKAALLTKPFTRVAILRRLRSILDQGLVA